MKFLPCIFAFLACVPFGMIFEIKDKKTLLFSGFLGFLGWLAFLVTEFIGTGTWGETIRYFLATLIVAGGAEILARILKKPATIFLIVGILPLVPGGGIYYTLEALIDGNTELFAYRGLSTAACAGAIAVGCSLVSSVARIITNFINRKKKVV